MSQALHEQVERLIQQEASRVGAPPAGFPVLPEIPGGRYVREDFHALEKEHVWRKSWVCIGREADVASPGDYRTFDKLGAPMIVVRGKDGTLRAFYNTCRHRGAPVVREPQGRTSLLRCQYHSWSYGLDGKLIGVPDERDFACLDKSQRGLIEVRCETWAGLIFLNEDPAAPPLADHLDSLPEELACVGMEKLRRVHYRSYIIECNWKAAMDAFLEVYHLKTIHPTNAAIMLDHEAAAMGLMPNGHSRMATRKKLNQGANFTEYAGAPDIASLPDFYRRNNVAYCLFPNVITPVDPVGFPLLLFWPRGTGECEMEAIYVGPDWGDDPRPTFWDSYTDVYDLVLDEDIRNLEPIQASLNSGAFTGMLVNYQERRIYWFHEEIDRRIGAAVPPELAVKQVLSAYIERRLPIAAE